MNPKRSRMDLTCLIEEEDEEEKRRRRRREEKGKERRRRPIVTGAQGLILKLYFKKKE